MKGTLPILSINTNFLLPSKLSKNSRRQRGDPVTL